MSTALALQPIMSEPTCVGDKTLVVRPIEIADAARLERMFGRLSRESVRLRFFSPIPRLPESTLSRFVHVDHWQHEALVALDGDEIIAVARYGESTASDASTGSAGRDAEVAVTVEDAWQRRGIGRRLTRRLALLAVDRGFDTFVARILPENRAALNLMRDLAPDASVRFDGGDYEARLPLPARTGPAGPPAEVSCLSERRSPHGR